VRSGYNGNDMGAYVEFRDERVVFFVRWLTRGKHSVSYRLRAEVPGKFSALPAKASAMYAPELKGNSEEIKLRIEDVGSVIKGAGAVVPVVPGAVVPVRVRNDKRGG
jgi:alpha-2-macroglobulin